MMTQFLLMMRTVYKVEYVQKMDEDNIFIKSKINITT